MSFRTIVAFASATVCIAPLALADDVPPLSTRHDGVWIVDLVCADVRVKGELVKGYDFEFPVTVTGGRLEGHYGTIGAPSSIAFNGLVREGGALEIDATGHSGASSYTIGQMPRGTPYSYTMRGSLGEAAGEAARVEIRPCKATFKKDRR